MYRIWSHCRATWVEGSGGSHRVRALSVGTSELSQGCGDNIMIKKSRFKAAFSVFSKKKNCSKLLQVSKKHKVQLLPSLKERGGDQTPHHMNDKWELWPCFSTVHRAVCDMRGQCCSRRQHFCVCTWCLFCLWNAGMLSKNHTLWRPFSVVVLFWVNKQMRSKQGSFVGPVLRDLCVKRA